MSTKETKPRRIRINMRIPEVLVEWAKRQARFRHTSVTQMVVDYLTKSKEEADAK